MPIFDFKCESCESNKDDEFVSSWETSIFCDNCGQEMLKQVATGIFGKCFPADGLYLEHVSATGETFHSTREMQRYAKDHNLELGALS